MKFCDVCGFLLSTITKTGELKFICGKCFKEFESTPNDTLMFSTGNRSDQKTSDQKTIDQLPKIVKNITHVASIPKAILFCKNCKKDKLISYIREKNDMTRVFVCTCGHYWRDS